MVSLLWARGGETRFSNSLTPHFSFTYAELSMHASRAVSPSTDVREPRHHHLRLEYAVPEDSGRLRICARRTVWGGGEMTAEHLVRPITAGWEYITATVAFTLGTGRRKRSAPRR